MVYMYLVRYAEDLPDLALLSISTFQKGLRVRQSAWRHVLFMPTNMCVCVCVGVGVGVWWCGCLVAHENRTRTS
jgi:hypothetical protein